MREDAEYRDALHYKKHYIINLRMMRIVPGGGLVGRGGADVGHAGGGGGGVVLLVVVPQEGFRVHGTRPASS